MLYLCVRVRVYVHVTGHSSQRVKNDSSGDTSTKMTKVRARSHARRFNYGHSGALLLRSNLISGSRVCLLSLLLSPSLSVRLSVCPSARSLACVLARRLMK